MKQLLFILIVSFTTLPTHSREINSMQQKDYTMLSLGDSYTIGEGVEEADRFPNQTVLQLHSKGIYLDNPTIIATTGWTTDELMNAIHADHRCWSPDQQPARTFDFVTLLIGVNNQYRGRDLQNYRKEFVELLELAIKFSGGKNSHVIVLSIPDWGVTAFAEGRDRKKIAEEIDLFNAVNKEESLKHNVQYIDITPSTREHKDWTVSDGLHPSGKEYAIWAEKVAFAIQQQIASEQK